MARGSGIRPSVWVVAAGLLAAGSAGAQLAGSDPTPPDPLRPAVGRLGLNPGRVQYSVGCGASLLPCADAGAALAARNDRQSLRWSMEASVLHLGLASRSTLAPTRQGLNLSLVGRKPLFGSSFSVYGRFGTTYGLPDATGAAALSGAPLDTGYGLSFGAGVSMAVTPRLSATFGWDAHDLRLNTGNRDAVRNTSLGLQYRY